MARHYRFFLRKPESARLLPEERLTLLEDAEPEIFFQLVKVLRAGPGDAVTLMAGSPAAAPERDEGEQYFEYDFEVVSVTKKSVELLKKGVRENTNELSFPLNLWLCLPNKPEKLEFILQKAVEIGGTGITLFEGDFSQMKHALRIDRLQKILLEAAEQAERAAVPELKSGGRLGEFLEEAAKSAATERFEEKYGEVWVAMERMGKASGWILDAKARGAEHPDAVKNASAPQKKRGPGISVLLGPEGGFSEHEKA